MTPELNCHVCEKPLRLVWTGNGFTFCSEACRDEFREMVDND